MGNEYKFKLCVMKDNETIRTYYYDKIDDMKGFFFDESKYKNEIELNKDCADKIVKGYIDSAIAELTRLKFNINF